MTSEQLEIARAERMRQNGLGTLTLDEARTWIEETGLCHYLPRRQFSTSVAPSFAEAVAGQNVTAPDSKQIALAEEFLVRLELEGVAVRLNLVGQPGEQPDFVVAAWVLPYVYALRGDRDWRRSPQLTGSRQVSQLAVLAYKQLEAGEANISQLKQALGREVTESAVLRAITELWQQLRIIPVIAAPGHAAKWQLLRTRFQKAIAEGASTSQVTAISVLASIYLQAVIAATMEEVELFLAPLTARSKIREVLRGLVATRQVHTIALGHAPHFYVAGTLPEFAPPSTLYSSSNMASSYFTRNFDREEERTAFYPFNAPIQAAPAAPVKAVVPPVSAPEPAPAPEAEKPHVSRTPVRRPAPESRTKPAGRSHFSRPAAHGRDRKPSRPAANGRPARRDSESRPAATGKSNTRSNGSWQKNGNGKQHARPASNGSASTRSNGRPAAGSARTGKPATWDKRKGHTGLKSAKPAASHKNTRHASSTRKPVVAASSRAGKSFSKQGNKKRG